MGQSYDDNANYIGWSPYFNHDSVEALQASKILPIPKGITITKGDYDVTNLINSIDFDNLDASNIRKLANLIRIVERHPAIKYNGDLKILDKVIAMLNKHEHYKIIYSQQEAAYKNIASANIYQVSHDIRNRDLAYTAIAMDIMRDAAENSPKGDLTGDLNMLNPLTTYIMLYLNLVGKNVISVAANGEKVWFNMFYYWNKVLKELENVDVLKFSLTFSRINGRAKNNLSLYKASYLPDLNLYDKAIKQKLASEFGVTEFKYKYVDLQISLLLSAATDNAKELILAKINAGTNFAKMYVYAMIVGLNINDTVAFMTCPVAELIDKLSLQNIFENYIGTPGQAINMMLGIVGISNRLHGTINDKTLNNYGEEEYSSTNKSTYIAKILSNKFPKATKGLLGLSLIMKVIINKAIDDKTINLRAIVKSSDTEVNSYILDCQDLINLLRQVRDKYDSLEDMQADIEEFKKLYNLSSEISTISSAWLGLNQGLPTSELDILKRLNRMSQIVFDRENLLDVDDNNMFKEKDATLDIVVNNILKNNPTVTNVKERLLAAHDAKLINNFDITKYLQDNDYRKLVIDYYGLLMGTVNVFDMMEKIPNYHTILELFKSVVVSNNLLVSKSRLINKITSKMKNITDSLMSGVIKYVDNLNAFNFLLNLPSIQVDEAEGFDPYFNKIKVSKIDLYTLNGIATFKHWVEHEFLDYLKTFDNPLVKHLTLIPNKDNTVLATDIDLMNPNITEESKRAYEEILRGISKFEATPYKDSNYSIADILMLYNLAVNKNLYGAERLTTIFKVCKNPNNIINKYLLYIGDLDYSGLELEYNNTDYLINSAPIVSSFSERYHQEPYIKVKDAILGVILKQYNATDNTYFPKSLVPGTILDESYSDKLVRILNFLENCPFELPNMYKTVRVALLIDYNGTLEEAMLHIEDVKNLLNEFSSSNKAIIIVDC